MGKLYEVEKLAKKGKFSFGNAIGHAGSAISTGMGINAGMNEDKRYAQELAARGIKDDRNWISRNAKALTSGLGGAAGGLLSTYITRKTGLAQNKKWYGKALNVGVGYAASTVGNKLANYPLKYMREKKLKEHDKLYGNPETQVQSLYYPGGDIRFYAEGENKLAPDGEVRKPAHTRTHSESNNVKTIKISLDLNSIDLPDHFKKLDSIMDQNKVGIYEIMDKTTNLGYYEIRFVDGIDDRMVSKIKDEISKIK